MGRRNHASRHFRSGHVKSSSGHVLMRHVPTAQAGKRAVTQSKLTLRAGTAVIAALTVG